MTSSLPNKLFDGQTGFPTPNAPPEEKGCRVFSIPSDEEYFALFMAAALTLTDEWRWYKNGDLTAAEAVAIWTDIIEEAYALSELGQCAPNVEAPYWDDSTADDADDEAPTDDQPWYGEIINEGVTWREQVGIWAITAFLAVAATPAAAIAFLPFANKFVLAFKQHSLGAIVKVLIDGVEMATVDTYAPANGVQNVTISLPAPAGFRAFDVDVPVLWVMNTGTANPAVEGTPTMAVIRKRLDASEVTPSNIRWNEDCDCVQQTPDNGATWVDSPTQDPRSSTIFQVPLRTTGDIQCDSAQQMHDQIKNMLDAIIASSSILQAINAVVGVVAFFFLEIGIVIEALWTIVTAIFGVGTTVLDAALTEGVYDAFLCILYCEISADGSVDLDQFNTIAGRVNDEIGGVAAFAITSAMQTVGFVGMTNAGALGEVTGDCSACDCVHCFELNFLEADGTDFGFVIQGGTWHAGLGWKGQFGDSNNISDVYGYWAFGEALNTDKIQMEYTKSGGSGSSNVNAFQKLSPATTYNTTILPNQNNLNTFGEHLLKEIDANEDVEGMGFDINSGQTSTDVYCEKLRVFYFGDIPSGWSDNC